MLTREDAETVVQGIVPVIRKRVEGLSSRMMDAIIGTIKGVQDRADQQVADLAARLDALAARGPSMEYRGTWQANEMYPKGSVVTHSGSMWWSSEDQVSGATPPGQGPTPWVLAVKRGRDGKDLR